MTDLELALIAYDGSDKSYADLVYKALKEMHKRENPKPLTFDELLQRSGKPVYCPETDAYYSGWGIVSNIDGRVITDDGFFPFDEYQENWLAYDHPPKGEQP